MKMARPKINLNYDLIKVMAILCRPKKEIADQLGVSVRTLERDAEFCRIYREKKAQTQLAIIQKQLDKALSGDNTMLIWTGKQMCGQSDKIEQKTESETSVKSIFDELIEVAKNHKNKKKNVSGDSV